MARGRRGHPATSGIAGALTDEEWEFARAMRQFQEETGIRYPTCRDVLRVAKALGYAKQADRRRRT